MPSLWGQGTPAVAPTSGLEGDKTAVVVWKARVAGDTLVQEKPAIGVMIERGGDVVMRLLANVIQEIIEPLIKTTRAPGMCLDPASRGAS
jgi:hypothetical protein